MQRRLTYGKTWQNKINVAFIIHWFVTECDKNCNLILPYTCTKGNLHITYLSFLHYDRYMLIWELLLCLCFVICTWICTMCIVHLTNPFILHFTFSDHIGYKKRVKVPFVIEIKCFGWKHASNIRYPTIPGQIGHMT